jgi:hypothetical protein
MRKKARIKPLAHIYGLDQAPMNASPLTGQWPCMNVMISSNRVERRWDHEVNRTFASGDNIQAVPIFRTNTGTTYVLVLTDTDLVKIMGGSGETYQYLTQTWAAGTVSNIVTTAVTGTDANCQWLDTSGIAAGDKFIMDDDHSAAIEPDTHWAQVASVASNVGMTLSAAYTGSDTSGTYKVRKVYSCPVGERWQWASVAGKFCFVNGSIQGQYWNGTDTYATDLNTTYCNQVRYCASYANRLITADMYHPDDSARNPWLVRWSKEGDPTDWTDSTAGFLEFMDSEEPITGLGTSGANLIVFKKNSYHIGNRTGVSSTPIEFPGGAKRGIGLYAPYSLVHVGGTVAWMGLNDFYYLNGDTAESIGGPIRKKFFDLVADDELETVFGFNNARFNEVLWVANTSAGQYVFSFNWKEQAWSTYQFSNTVTGLGGWGA